MIGQFNGEYKWLSNFASVKIVLDGIEYQSVEHAYMSAKNDSPDWKRFCSDKTNHAYLVKNASRRRKLVDNWEDIKVDVMRKCLEQKFSQEPFRSKLLATGTELLQEGNDWNDKFWGVTINGGEGKNKLGELIMIIRGDLSMEDKKDVNGLEDF